MFDPQLASGQLFSVSQHTIDATYNGDGNFSAAVAPTITQTITRANTGITLMSSASSPVYGQSVTITATVAPSLAQSGPLTPQSPSGTVTFTVNGVPLASGPVTVNNAGQATFTLSNLNVNIYRISASYSGDNNYNSSNTAADTVVNVQKSSSSTVLSANPSTSQVGTPVTFTAVVSPVNPGSGTATGTVTFKDTFGGSTIVLGSVNLSGVGVATLQTSALSVGSHMITASYSGDTNFNASNNTITSFVVTVDSSTTSLSSSENPSNQGDAVTFTATVTTPTSGVGTPSGTVTFKIDSSSIPVTLNSSGVATYTTATLTNGSHAVTAVYTPAANSTFGSSTSPTITQSVKSASSVTLVSSGSPSIYGQTVSFTATVAPVAPGTSTPQGQVTFIIDNGAQQSTQALVNGKATFSTSNLSAGTHTVTAVYAGDNGSGFNTSSSSPVTQVVVASGTSTSASASALSVVYGQPVTLTATVTAATGVIATGGTVSFYLGTATAANLIGTANVNNSGVASLTTSTIPATQGKQIVAVFNGTTNLGSSTGVINNFVVNQASSTTSITTSNPSTVYGQSVTFTATVAPVTPSTGLATGTVTFFFDGPSAYVTVPVNANGVAVLTTSAVNAGNHKVTAVYNGDTNFTGSSSATISQNVAQAATSLALSGPATSTVFGQPASFTATVTPTTAGAGTPIGPVTFFVDGNSTGVAVPLNAAGQAIYSPTNLSVGSHSVTASFAGNGNFGSSASSAPAAVTVAKANSTTTVTSSVNPSAQGQPVTFTISAVAQAPGSGTPTGTITVLIDGTPQGSPVTLNAQGQAIIQISSLSVGQHTISASYSGDGNFNASGPGTAFTQTVATFGSTTSIAPSSATTVFGQAASFTATVTSPGGTPNGTVTFVVDNVAQSPVTLNGSGQATFTSSTLSTGQHSINAIYNGNATFGSSTAGSAASLTVTKVNSSITITPSSSAAPYGTSVSLTATVAPVAPGFGTATGTVTFIVNGVAQTPVALNAQGQAFILLNKLPAGTNGISATYNGNGSFNGSSTTTNASVKILATTTVAVSSASATTVYGQTMSFTATISTTAPGSLPPASGYLFFFINGNYAGSSVLNTTTPNQGTLTINASTFGAPLQAGSYTVTAFYNGDSNYTISPASAAITQTIAKANDTVTVTSSANPSSVGQSFTLTATAHPVAPGTGFFSGPMYFYVNNNYFGSATANSSGVAIFNVTSATFGGALPAGSYTFTAVYGGDKNFTQSAQSAAFTQTVQPAVGHLYASLVAPAGVTANTSFGVQVVAADTSNNFASHYNGPATIMLLSGPTGASLLGNLNTTFVNGVANFTNLDVTASGQYTLRITSAGVIVDLTFFTNGRLS